MEIRLVLYGEGPTERSGEITLPPAPGNPLLEEALGAAHLLVRQCIVRDATLPEDAVRFDSPLRVGPRDAKGSDLLRRRTLRKLLHWPAPQRRPHIAVVVIDRDGRSDRKDSLLKSVAGLSNPVIVIGVAREEFEAWLLGDVESVRRTLGCTIDEMARPESMSPREAKAVIHGLLTQHSSSHRALAAACDVDVVGRRCPSFESFRSELRSAITVIACSLDESLPQDRDPQLVG